MKIHILKKKKKKKSLLFPPIIDISIDRSNDEGILRCRTDTLRITCCRTDGSLPVVRLGDVSKLLLDGVSVDIDELKVLVAEVESPRHLVGFHRPGAFQTVFRLGALTFSTDFLTASRRAKSAE